MSKEKHIQCKWVYQKSETSLWTVGYYSPSGKWKTDSDHSTPKRAAIRTAWLNGEKLCNSHQLLVDACKRAQTRLAELGQNESCRTITVLKAAIAEAEKKG